ncbi:MAG: inorganic phosphate transporter [Bacteroidales bacterium]|nr:inorganic phosphate transporter [Bacteroidales bacterium]
METLLPVIVGIVILLAIMGLCAGVSNDASNFMSAAVGTGSASYRVVTIIASAGIIFGSLMSNGMMEIARKGVFAPEYFYANELIYIFISVIISNLLLLDIFNRLGLPTSTSVSLVFELIGASFAISLFKIRSGNCSVGMSELINTDKAMTMILGIFVSVAVAFVFSIVIQWITRIIFTFNYKRNLKYKIGIFGGIATTALIYFMLIKGMGGAPFMKESFKLWINEHTMQILGLCFVFFSVLMQILYFLKFNVLKIIVLIGTFALAMAFAGNDLVNFIGVPLACLDTYLDVKASGAPLDQHLMGSLNQPANASMVYIIIAGIIMVITLLTSKKAKIVLQTSLDLSKQNTGDESFGTSYAARAVVRFFNNLANSVVSIVPQKVKAWINSRFNQKEIIIEDNAAFDLIRGLVSIVLASMLIAVGTSLKMPLSTTYVVFMVSMGASFADRAWSRESAVFRVTGVFSVIGGWLITAVVAFFLAFVFALFLNFTGIIGTIISIALALYFILIDSRKAAQEDDDTDKAFDEAMRTNDKAVIMNCILDHNRESLMSLINDSKTMYNQITQAFVDEDIKVLRNMTSQCKIEKNSMKMLKRKEIQMMRRLDESEIFRKNTWFHLNYNCIEQILYSLRRICEPCKEYVDNSFSPLGKEYVEELNKVKEMTNWAIDAANIVIYSSDYKEHEIVMDRIKRREDELMNISIEQMNRIQKKHENIDLSVLYLNIIQESVEIVTEMRHILRNSAKMNEKI